MFGSRSVGLRLRDVAPSIREAFFPAAPTGIHPVRRFLENGLDSTDLVLLNLEKFGDLPCKGASRPGRHVASIGGLEVPRIACRVIEKRKAEGQSAFRIDRH